MISKSILITLQCVSCLLLIIGIILIFSGMFTSSWLVADFEVDHHIHHHGLWRDCQLLGGTFGGRIRATGEWLCFSKIDKQNIDPEHQFKSWHIQVLILFGSANGIAFFALILLTISYCHGKLCCVPWAVMSFISLIVASAAIFLFCFWTTESENRFAKLMAMQVEQQYGSAFYMAVSGCILYLIQTILAVVSCVLICTQRRGFQAVPTSYPANQNGNKPWQYAKPERQQSHNTVV